jgi:hypothetical protein
VTSRASTGRDGIAAKALSAIFLIDAMKDSCLDFKAALMR